MDIGLIIDHQIFKTENDLTLNIGIRPFFFLLCASEVWCSQWTYILLRAIRFRSVHAPRVSNRTDKIALLLSYF
jgi:hypothetical protein